MPVPGRVYRSLVGQHLFWMPEVRQNAAIVVSQFDHAIGLDVAQAGSLSFEKVPNRVVMPDRFGLADAVGQGCWLEAHLENLSIRHGWRLRWWFGLRLEAQGGHQGGVEFGPKLPEGLVFLIEVKLCFDLVKGLFDAAKGGGHRSFSRQGFGGWLHHVGDSTLIGVVRQKVYLEFHYSCTTKFDVIRQPVYLYGWRQIA